MTKAEFAGVIRAFLTAGFSWAAAKGWLALDTEAAQGLVAALTTLAVAGWSVKAKRAA